MHGRKPLRKHPQSLKIRNKNFKNIFFAIRFCTLKIHPAISIKICRRNWLHGIGFRGVRMWSMTPYTPPPRSASSVVIATSHLAESLPSLWVSGTCEEASLAGFRRGWSQIQRQPKSAAFFTYSSSMPCCLRPCIYAVLYTSIKFRWKGLRTSFFVITIISGIVLYIYHLSLSFFSFPFRFPI